MQNDVNQKPSSSYLDGHPLPFVSVCTPTYNRRPFIEAIKTCFKNQTYPQKRMEWIIIDDGTDKIGELFNDIPNAKYYSYDEKMPLGKKRNLMHTKAKGDIIVYMDDDDYYPRERVSHAVGELMRNPRALCAGSSEIYIHFNHIDKMYQFGPYGPHHATAGTFAFRKELLKTNKYDDSACLAEEKVFLNDYTVPFVQLNPVKTILVFSHEHNTFDKKKLLVNRDEHFVKETNKTVDDFVKEPELKQFFMSDIVTRLNEYDPGKPSMKPDVLQQMVELEKKRQQEALERNKGKIVVKEQDGRARVLETAEVINLLKQQNTMILKLQEDLDNRDLEIKLLKYELEKYTKSKEQDTESVAPIDIDIGVHLDIQETDILVQINDIN